MSRRMACGLIMILMAASWAGAQAPAGKRPDIKLGGSCVTADCHGDVKQGKFVHGPTNLNQCEPCHIAQNNQHVFKAAASGKDLCLICHQTEATKKVVHKPFAADCTMCHNPHKSDNRYFVKGGLGGEACMTCHSDVRQGLPFTHGPVGQGECLACHTPHQSDHKHLLTEDETTLCFSCHTDFKETMAGAVSVHAPAQKDCGGCHGAHGGKNKVFLKAEGRELCASCHGDFLKSVDKFKHPHKPLGEGKACQSCHAAHASKQQKLLAGDNMELCLSCHNKPIQTATRTLPNIEDQVKGAKFLHGPLRQSSCIACHAAHGSDYANILDKAFPANFYAPYTDQAYDLCFNCHDKKVVLSERGMATGFRNGELNLHWLHVNREKGRSCRACHHEHASNQPKHIRDAVPFGRWTMHTEYTKTETGGGCTTGCHLPYKYDRNSPVDNKTSGAKQSAGKPEPARAKAKES